MKSIIAALSVTGKAGKSTVANTLLRPRMDIDPANGLLSVETINESGKASATAQKFKGRDTEQILKALAKLDSAIVDVGTSNVETFILGLTQQTDAQRMFDYFIVPVEANGAKVNEFKEAIKTFEMLKRLGVEPERIKVVFNKLLPDNRLETEMARIINFHKQYPIFTLNKRAVIHETLAFKALEESKMSYEEILADKTDYWKKLKDTPLPEEAERANLVKMARAQGLMKGLDAELDGVFNALFGTARGAAKESKALVPETVFDASLFD